VFDALRLKYLRMLSFGFYRDKDEKELIEAYEFKGVAGGGRGAEVTQSGSWIYAVKFMNSSSG